MPRANMLVRPLLRMDDHIRVWLTRPIVYLLLTDALLWTASYTCYTISCPLVENKCVYIYIYDCYFMYMYLCIFLSLFSPFFFFATCHSLIRYQSRRSVFSRWEPRVIFGLVCVASYAQVSCLYIMEFLRYPLHLQNLLFWPSSSRASSRSLCVHRLLPSRSRYLLFSSSLGLFFSFSKNF